MDTQLLQKILELENKRKIEYEKYISFFKSQQKKILISVCFFCSVVILMFLLNYLWDQDVNAIESGYSNSPSSLVYNYFLYIIILISAAIVSFIVVIKNIRVVVTEAFPFGIFAKQEIMPLILQEFGEDFVYTSKGRIFLDKLNKFEKIVPKRDCYVTTDHIRGTYHGYRTEFQELIAKQEFPAWLDHLIHADARYSRITPFSILAIWGFFFTFSKVLRGKTVTFDTPRILCFMFESSQPLHWEFALECKNQRLREYSGNIKSSEFDDHIGKSLKILEKLSEKKLLKFEVKGNGALLLIYGTHDLFEIGKLNRAITQQEVEKNIAEAKMIMSTFKSIIQVIDKKYD